MEWGCEEAAFASHWLTPPPDTPPTGHGCSDRAVRNMGCRAKDGVA